MKWTAIYIGAALAMAGAALAQPAAPGHYLYEWDGGKTAGGSPILVSYDLRVGPGSCRLGMQGFQTDETILCDAVAAPDGLLIRFRSYDDGKVVNHYGVTIYKPGDDLLRLRSTPGAALLTEWLKLRPDEQSTQPAVRFRGV